MGTTRVPATPVQATHGVQSSVIIRSEHVRGVRNSSISGRRRRQIPATKANDTDVMDLERTGLLSSIATPIALPTATSPAQVRSAWQPRRRNATLLTLSIMTFDDATNDKETSYRSLVLQFKKWTQFFINE